MKKTAMIGMLACAGTCAAATLDFSGIFPPGVKCVYVVAPSSHANNKVVIAATNEFVRCGYKVKVADSVWKYSADAAVRARDLEKAWQDPETDAILCSRGGKGGFDTVTNLNFEILRSRDLPFIGFSNISTLMNAFIAKGVKRPITGPMCTSLVSYPSTRDSITRLSSTVAGAPLEPVQLKVLRAPAKTVKGKSAGGHWPSISRMTKEWLPSTDGRIIFLEINASYTLDKAKDAFGVLKEKGFFAHAAAVVICSLNIKGTKAERQQLTQFIVDSVTCPVFGGYPYGHVKKLYAIDYNREATISEQGLLTWQ